LSSVSRLCNRRHGQLLADEGGVWGGMTVAERAVLKRERLHYAAEPQAACLG